MTGEEKDQEKIKALKDGWGVVASHVWHQSDLPLTAMIVRDHMEPVSVRGSRVLVRIRSHGMRALFLAGPERVAALKKAIETEIGEPGIDLEFEWSVDGTGSEGGEEPADGA